VLEGIECISSGKHPVEDVPKEARSECCAAGMLNRVVEREVGSTSKTSLGLNAVEDPTR